MQTIGNYLKSGREARNIRLSEVARSTKISKWYLDCLEKDDFDKIPEGPYIKGYIASYASFIGLEEDEILKRYDSLQINSADENEIQDHQPQDKERPKLLSFSLSKKYLLILSMAVLILLAFGFIYFYFPNQTHTVAQLQDTPASKMQSAPSSKLKQEAESASHLTDLSKNNLNPIKTEDETHPTYQDATGAESLALLPSKKEVDGTSQAFLMEENDIHSQTRINKEPIIHDAPSSSEKNSLKRPALTDSKKTLPQDTPGTADLYLESAPGNQTPDAQSQAVNNMRVIRAVAAGDVINKNPAELGDPFQWSMEKVYIWTMIECEQPPSSIRHTYYFKGQKVNDVVLEIKSSQWRTWSYKNLLNKRYIGQWRVDITSEEGKLLQSVFFEVN
jgi:cytoskeletal protein RodZ